MRISDKQIADWINAREDAHVEFKEAREGFDAEHKLPRYCAALANEGGGYLILGITDKLPRKLVGTQAFEGRLHKVVASLQRQISQIHIDAEEYFSEGKRIVIFSVAGRPLGVPLDYRGAYLCRSGDETVAMRPQQIELILEERRADFSGEPAAGATLESLDTEAIDAFRHEWIRKSGNTSLSNISNEQLLSDAGLLRGEIVTNAALILLGTGKALDTHLANAELVYEYRIRDNSIEYQDRQNYRRAFFVYVKELESRIEARNNLVHVRDGFLMRSFQTFNPEVVREAVLNAVTHRDYRLPGSVFLKQSPTRMVIESPGGFPVGVTPENILDRRAHRNRLIAETFERCGFVERSGQGMNRIFESTIQEGKPVPSFEGTDAYRVVITLDGTVDPRLVRFMEEIGRETLESFDTWDYVAVRNAYLNKPLTPELRERAKKLTELGVLERTGYSGRGTRYIPSQRFHRFLGEKASYTRRKGLDKQTNKHLLLKSIQDHFPEGCPLRDLSLVLPNLEYRQVQRLVQELKNEGKIRREGIKRTARWYPAEQITDAGKEPISHEAKET